jgi:cytochrome P450
MRLLPVLKETFARDHFKAMAADAPSFLLDCTRQVGPDLWLGVGNVTMTVLSSPEALQHVLQKRASVWGRGSTLAETRPLLGSGLVVSDPPLWLRQRRTMQPAFHQAQAARWLELSVQATDRALGRLVPDDVFHVRHALLRLTRETIVQALFSDSLDADADGIAEAFEVIEAFMGARSTLVTKLPVTVPTPQTQRYREAIAFLDERLFGLVARRRAKTHPPAHHQTRLLRATDPDTGEGMSDPQLRDELMNVFIAGHETTANVVTWALALLALHPHEAALVQAEVTRELGTSTPTLESVARLTRVAAVVRETMRLYPPVCLVAREALEDDEVRSVRMRKGSVVLLPLFVTHRTSALWDEPELFRPDRFRSESSTDATVWKFRYLPFGAGPHVCIGMRLALLECAVVLARFFQRGRLTLEAPQSVRHALGATLMVADGLPARFRPHAAD